jgi:hypothetical protein
VDLARRAAVDVAVHASRGGWSRTASRGAQERMITPTQTQARARFVMRAFSLQRRRCSRRTGSRPAPMSPSGHGWPWHEQT